ncbi:hypothetical protein QE152_g26914 [Popillia japonica]|uniref:Uncharacterized protein n=1 Tax=Popillia japonica TaxID=7064 RepID=A0AAW1JX88_POPJA
MLPKTGRIRYNYQKRVESDIIANPKAFWSFVNNRRSSSRIPGSMTCNEVDLTQPLEIVNGFANWFSSVYHPFVSDAPIPATFTSYPSFNVSYVTEEEVFQNPVPGSGCQVPVSEEDVEKIITRDVAEAGSSEVEKPVEVQSFTGEKKFVENEDIAIQPKQKISSQEILVIM